MAKKKTNFRIGFLCKSFGKQTEMCIKLQQCNKLRDAKVQQGIKRWRDCATLTKIEGFQHSRNLATLPAGQVQWYAKNCMSLRWQPGRRYPRGERRTPWTVARGFFYVVCFFGKLTVWPQCLCVYCYCYCSCNWSAKSLISWWPRRLRPRPAAPGFLFFYRASACFALIVAATFGSLDELGWV